MGGEGKSAGTEGSMTEQRLLEELTEALRRGDVTRFNTLRKQHPDKPLEFRGLKLTTGILNLVGIDLSGCTLQDISFDGLNLTNAKFDKAIFFGCSFQRTNLSGTRFHSCRFDRKKEGRSTRFHGANGYGTDFSNATFVGTRLGPVTFRQCTFNDARFVNVGECRTRADLEGSTFHNATFEHDPNSPGYFPEPELSFVTNLSPAQEEQLKKTPAPPALGDQFRAATSRIETERPDADEPDLGLSAPPASASPSRPEPTIAPEPVSTNVPATPDPQGEKTMAQQQPASPSFLDKIARSAKEGGFRFGVNLFTSTMRAGLVELLDSTLPLEAATRQKVIAALESDAGTAIFKGILSQGLHYAPLEHIPWINPELRTLLKERVVDELGAQSMHQIGDLAGKFIMEKSHIFKKALSGFGFGEDAPSEPPRLGEPARRINDFQDQQVPAAAAAPAAPTNTNGQQNS